MAKFTLKIDCDNAAFDGEPANEIARILREVGRMLIDLPLRETPGNTGHGLRDVNGNTVGRWEFVA